MSLVVCPPKVLTAIKNEKNCGGKFFGSFEKVEVSKSYSEGQLNLIRPKARSFYETDQVVRRKSALLISGCLICASHQSRVDPTLGVNRAIFKPNRFTTSFNVPFFSQIGLKFSSTCNCDNGWMDEVRPFLAIGCC